MIVIKIIKALVVRAALALHSILAVWRVTVTYDDDIYWLMACTLIPLAIETLYTVIKRHGDEFKWFTPCFFFYLVAVVPCVWLLELDKSANYNGDTEDEPSMPDNSTVISQTGLDLNPAMWNIIIEEMLFYLLIVSRWILPRGKVTREQLSELLFAFLGIAADIAEMFSLFAEEVVRTNMYMGYWILTVWSVSVLQFSMTVTVTHQPKKAKNIKVIEDLDEAHENAKVRNEILAIFLSMLMQDVPFLVIRLYTIIYFDLITYSLIFFVSKNILVILLLMYKVIVILQKRFCPAAEDDEDDDEEVVIAEDGRMVSGGKMTRMVTSVSQASFGSGNNNVLRNGKQRGEGSDAGSSLKKRKVAASGKASGKRSQKQGKRASKSANTDRNTNVKPTKMNPAAVPYLANDPNPAIDGTSENAGSVAQTSPATSQASKASDKVTASDSGSGVGKQSPDVNSDGGFGSMNKAPSSLGSDSPSTSSGKSPETQQEVTKDDVPLVQAKKSPDAKSQANEAPSTADDTPEPAKAPSGDSPKTSRAKLPKPGDADFKPYVTVVKIA